MTSLSKALATIAKIDRFEMALFTMLAMVLVTCGRIAWACFA